MKHPVLLFPVFLLAFLASHVCPAYSLNLGGPSHGYSAILGPEWRLLPKSQHDEIASVLVAPYDRDGSKGMAQDVQGAVTFGEEPASFRQLTVVPIKYDDLPEPEDVKAQLQKLDRKTLNAQQQRAEEGFREGGIKIINTGTLPDGFWILGSVNNSIMQEVQMRYTKKGALMVLLFAGGTDKKAENAVKDLGKKIIISPSARLSAPAKNTEPAKKATSSKSTKNSKKSKPSQKSKQ